MPKIGRALISVYDKNGIVEFAKGLQRLGIEIISTGGTAKHLNESGIKTTAISEITGFPEILAGRVKTLHPKIFGGLLALRSDGSQMKEIDEHSIKPLDLVVVNLYPFERTIADKSASLQDALENIDIGGPSLIRAAAKNYQDVTVVTSPAQYSEVLAEIEDKSGETSLALRRKLAATAFSVTSNYDAKITAYLQETEDFSPNVSFQFEKIQDLRYGENPHQKAALYRKSSDVLSGLVNAKQLHGKELSFNNLIDLDAALGVCQEFEETCAVIIKHTNPCGVATGETLQSAFLNAKATDPVSAFGSIIGCNRSVDEATAQAISEMFVEAVLAPAFDPAALKTLQSKKNLRLIQSAEATNHRPRAIDIKTISGGFLLQDTDNVDSGKLEYKVVTKREPSPEEWTALKFGWRVCKWIKSNAIVYCLKDRTIGIGAGQMSRVDSSNIAVEKAGRMGLDLTGTVMASDAFFPFRDGIDVAAQSGARAVIQPGGSIRDDEVIAAADEHDMAMIFTGIRHFRH